MANWSNTNINFTSNDKKSIKTLELFIDTDAFNSFLKECKFDTNGEPSVLDDAIFICGESRYEFDGNNLDDLLPILKKLNISLEVTDSASGNNFVCRWQSDDDSESFFYEEDSYTSQLYIDIYGEDNFLEDKSFALEDSESIEEFIRNFEDVYDLLISNNIMTHKEIENEFKQA